MARQPLRGRVLYVLLGALTIILYAAAARPIPGDVLGRAPQHPVSDAGAASDSSDGGLAWWPPELDADTLKPLARSAPRWVGALAAFVMASSAMAFAGLLLALRALWSGQAHACWRFLSPPLPRWTFGEAWRMAAVLAFVVCALPFVRIALIASQLLAPADAHLWMAGSMLFLDACAILTVWAFAAERSPSALETFGLRRHHAVPSMRVGLTGYVAVFPWLFIGLFAIVTLLWRLGIQPPVEPIQEMVFDERRPVALGLTVLLACVVGPVAEEMVFRGVVYPMLRRWAPRLIAILISGALFSLIHTNLVGFAPIMLLGCLLAYVYERTGSLLGPLAVHLAHNAFLMSGALVFRQLLLASEHLR